MSGQTNGFSSVVSDLVRHQLGAGAQNVGDTDLDAYVAEMLVKEAKARETRFGTEGVKAYFSDEDDKAGPSHRPSKRFLLSLVKNVDDHNQALLRQEQDEASQRKADREVFRSEKDRQQGSGGRLFALARNTMGTSEATRPKRHREQASSRTKSRYASGDESLDRSREKDRHRSSRYHSDRDPEKVSNRDEDDRRRHRRRSRDFEEEEEGSSRHRSSRRNRRYSDDSDSHHRRRDDRDRRRYPSDEDDDDEKASDRRHKRRRYPSDEENGNRKDRERSPSTKHRSKRRERARSSSAEADDKRPNQAITANVSREDSVASSSKAPARSSTVKEQIVRVQPPSRSPTPGDSKEKKTKSHRESAQAPQAQTSTNGPSKMDKYFEASYDPRLDVSVADLTDPYGFISEGNFDEWSHMLDILKVRKEEKNFRAAEKEAERLRLIDEQKDKELARKLAKKRKETSMVEGADGKKSKRSKMDDYAAVSGSALLSIEGYAKKRGNAEWRNGQPDMSF